MKHIRQYDGIYGDDSYRIHPGYLYSEQIQTRSAGFDWVIHPHLHPRLFQVFLLETGQVEVMGTGEGKSFHAPCILAFSPGVLHGFRYSPDVTGRILTVSDSYLDEFIPRQSFIPLGSQMLVQIGPEHAVLFAAILDVVSRIDREVFSDFQEKNQLLGHYFGELRILMGRLVAADTVPRVREKSASRHFRAFQQALSQAGPGAQVADMAAAIGVSAAYLNRLCKAAVGKPVSVLLQERTVQQAAKYLLHTSYSISEIAYLLGFEYPNYFARLFRKHTGQSPAAYRASQGDLPGNGVNEGKP